MAGPENVRRRHHAASAQRSAWAWSPPCLAGLGSLWQHSQIFRPAWHQRCQMGRPAHRRLCPMNATLENPSNLNLVLDVPVSLTIELGGCKLPMREVLQLNIGSVIQLDNTADRPVELSVNGKLIARGEVVVIEDRYGVKITEVIGQPPVP